MAVGTLVPVKGCYPVLLSFYGCVSVAWQGQLAADCSFISYGILFFSFTLFSSIRRSRAVSRSPSFASLPSAPPFPIGDILL